MALLASWERSKEFGVRTDLTEAPLAGEPEIFRRRAANVDLLEVARPALDRSGAFLADASSMMILTDASGFIVEKVHSHGTAPGRGVGVRSSSVMVHRGWSSAASSPSYRAPSSPSLPTANALVSAMFIGLLSHLRRARLGEAVQRPEGSRGLLARRIGTCRCSLKRELT